MNSKYTNPNSNVREQDANDRADDQEEVPETSSSAGDQNERKGHESIKGTDTLATTDAETMEREKGKRTTM